MDSNDELKEIDIKNRTCYYFDVIIKIEDFDINNILIDEKPFENVLVYNISYKSLIGFKPLGIRLDEKDGCISVYAGNRYLVLFRSEKCDYIYNRIRYCGISGISKIEPINLMQNTDLIKKGEDYKA